MILSTQYYRPPFPQQHRWDEDLRTIRATGFDAIYVTATWSWVEPAPGEYVFDDYERLFAAAEREGLRVIVNLWSEIQPTWVEREIPGSAMIDHTGKPVVSSHMTYTQFGLTPGSCTDHPEVRKRAGDFLSAFVSHFAGAPALHVWDCWNEMRFMSQADGHVCFCEHTQRGFQSWLQDRYPTLDALNAAWQRRYRSWEDVLPGRLPTRTYTDAMAQAAWLMHRTLRDLRWRSETVRAADPSVPVIAHAAFPATSNTGEFFDWEPPLARGDDWELAEVVDAFGSSHFPAWLHPSPADFGARLEASRCATGDKPYWISELQGGAAASGMQGQVPVHGDRQARWVWNGVARGVKGINFWCWRDETFGRESAGYGIVGEDGHREERLAALARCAELFRAHEPLLDAYKPAQPEVGVVFVPGTYHLDWASYLPWALSSDDDVQFQAGHSVQAYMWALERTQVPYDVVHPSDADALDRYRVLFMPWPLVTDPALTPRLLDWVRAGGTLLTEAELDAFDDAGLYRYPGERPFAQALGLEPIGRRPLDGRTLAFELDDVRGELRAGTWVEPQRLGADATALASDERGASIVRRRLGAGTVVAVGTYAGTPYYKQRYADFERFVEAVVHGAGATPAIRCDASDGEVVQWRFGRSGETPLLFVINEGEAVDARFTLAAGLVPAGACEDLASGRTLDVVAENGVSSLTVPLDAGGYHVVRFGAAS